MFCLVLSSVYYSSTMYVQFNYKYCVPMLMAGQTIALGITCELAQGCYPVCVCTAGLCVWSCRFVYIYKYIRKPTRRVCVCVCVCPKNWLFEVLSPENLLLVQFTGRSLSLTAKKGAYYTRSFIQGKKFRGILLKGQEKVSGKLYYGTVCTDSA